MRILIVKIRRPYELHSHNSCIGKTSLCAISPLVYFFYKKECWLPVAPYCWQMINMQLIFLFPWNNSACKWLLKLLLVHCAKILSKLSTECLIFVFIFVGNGAALISRTYCRSQRNIGARLLVRVSAVNGFSSKGYSILLFVLKSRTFHRYGCYVRMFCAKCRIQMWKDWIVQSYM